MRGARIADKIQEFYQTGTGTNAQPIAASQTSYGNFLKIQPNINGNINRSEI